MFTQRETESIAIDPTRADDHDNLNFYLEQHDFKCGGISKNLSLPTMLIEPHSNYTKKMRAYLTHELMKYDDFCYMVLANEPRTFTPPEELVHIRYTYKILGELRYNNEKKVWHYNEKLLELDVESFKEKSSPPQSPTEMSLYEQEVAVVKNNPMFDLEYEIIHTPDHLGLKDYDYLFDFEETPAESPRIFSFLLFKKPIEGTTLASIIADERTGKLKLSTRDRLGIAMALLIALDEQVHQQGLVHRNLTPHYLKLRQDPLNKHWKATITQYRLCKEFDDKDQDLPFKGNHLYASPEALEMTGTNEASDLFAAACLICELFGLNRSESISDNVSDFYLDGFLEGQYAVNDTHASEQKIRYRLFDIIEAMTNTYKDDRCSVSEAINSFDKIISLIDEATVQACLTTRTNSL